MSNVTADDPNVEIDALRAQARKLGDELTVTKEKLRVQSDSASNLTKLWEAAESEVNRLQELCEDKGIDWRKGSPDGHGGY